jgi:radical SAM superfamily enzyme YgiQ (UPF0313 family)
VDLIYEATRNLPFDPILFAYTRLDLLAKNPDTIHKLYDSGVRGFYFGVETLIPESRGDIRKPKNFQKEMKTLEDMDRRYGNSILTHGSFIVGLPGDTVENIRETARLAKSMPFSTYIFQTLMLYKQAGNWNLSDLDKNYTDYGYVDCEPVNSIFVNYMRAALTGSIPQIQAPSLVRAGSAEAYRMTIQPQIDQMQQQIDLQSQQLAEQQASNAILQEMSSNIANIQPAQRRR